MYYTFIIFIYFEFQVNVLTVKYLWENTSTIYNPYLYLAFYP